MKNMNTLIIETDATVCQRLKDVIQEAEGVLLAGSLGEVNRSEVSKKLGEVNPDVLLLGINKINSKEMKLFDTLRKERPGLPIIVLPRHDREGAAIALKALKNGAVEYINKTMSFSGSVHTAEHFRKLLIPVIKVVPRLNKIILGSGKNVDMELMDIKQVSSEYVEDSLIRMELLVIVGCLGGVPALYRLLSSLPENLPVPVVVVQHMPKIFTAVFAEDLNSAAKLNVQEAEDGSVLQAGQVYIAPGDFHAKVNSNGAHKFISLNREAKVNGYRPAIDVLLKSISKVVGNRVLVVYLSGGGNDGIEGAEVIDTLGGQIIIQNRSSSLFWDLPFKVDFHGLEEGSYPLERLGRQITKRLI